MELFVFFIIVGAAVAQDSTESLESGPSASILRSSGIPQAPSVRRVQSNALEGPVVEILRKEQHMPDADGLHSFDFEADNGIKFQFSGAQGDNGGANMQGVYSYPMEDGSIAEVTFVADENGYQPDSSLLPVAPAFPHPIPQYVLDQIAFARLEDERKAREGGAPTLKQ